MIRFFACLCAALVGSGTFLVSGRPWAQQYPVWAITVVSPYSAGGNADLAARSLAAAAPQYIGQSIVVIDKGGAGGLVGSQFVLGSARDGYTLLLARVGSQAILPALEPTTPYKWDGFTILGMLELDPYVCVVNGKSPIASFQDLAAALKAHPHTMNYGSTGAADASVVFPVKIFLNLGLAADAAVKVPYKGAGETVTAVLGGQVEFACNGIAPYAGAIKSGALRALVVSTHARVPEAPDTPTAVEVGMPDLEAVSGWSALYGPPNLPRAVRAAWTAALSKVKDDPVWNKSVRIRGSLPSVMSPEETARFVEDQYNAYRSLAPQLSIETH